MDMTNSITIAAPRTRVWEALNDPATLKRCIAGCESIEATGDNAYKVAMTVAIGPVKAKFKGDLMLEDIDAPNAYTIRFSGQGGVAGFGKGSARVTLSESSSADGSAVDGGTRLDYTVDAQVGGKIAQVGSRLIDGASKKMADDFFKAFRREVEVPVGPADEPASLAPKPAPEPAPEPRAPAPAVHQATDTSHDAAATSHEPAAPSYEPAPTSREAVDDLMVQALSHERWTWLAIAVAVAATGLLMLKR